MHKILEQNEELRQALFKAYLKHVVITYSGGGTATGYITFSGAPDWTPLIKARFMDSHGHPLQIECIAKITWGKNTLYSVPDPDPIKSDLANWMDAGAEFTAQAGGQGAILSEAAALNWHPLPCQDVPFSQGYALGHLIKEIVTGKPTRIAWDGVFLNRYGLIGIEAEYSNGTYRHYWADTGTGLVPLVSVREV